MIRDTTDYTSDWLHSSLGACPPSRSSDTCYVVLSSDLALQIRSGRVAGNCVEFGSTRCSAPPIEVEVNSADGDVFVGILAGAIREPLQEYDIRFPGSEQRKRFILRFRLGKWNSALPTHLCSLPCSPAKPQESTAEQNACGKMTRPRH